MKKRILVLGGHSGVAGDLLKFLGSEDVFLPERSDADLSKQDEVDKLFSNIKPDEVYHLAARIAVPKDQRNEPWGIFRDNLLIQLYVLDACLKNGCKKIVWFSSDSALPYYDDYRAVSEKDLFSAPVKREIESYALAKLAGIRMCENIVESGSMNTISLLPCNIYGRVKKGLMYNLCWDFLDAKREGRNQVIVFGGMDLQYRFIHTRDLANAAVFLMDRSNTYGCYIASGESCVTKKKLVSIIAACTGYRGEILFDTEKKIRAQVNAAPTRLMKEGWKPVVDLEEGVQDMVNWLRTDLSL